MVGQTIDKQLKQRSVVEMSDEPPQSLEYTRPTVRVLKPAAKVVVLGVSCRGYGLNSTS